MLKKDKNIIKVIVLIALCILTIIILMPKAYAGVVTPNSNEKIQFRAVSIEENNGKQQLIVEAWIQNLNFKAIDLRLQYDSSLLSLSDIETNETVDIDSPLIVPDNFEFCNNFEQFMELAGYDKQAGELTLLFSSLTEDEVTETSNYYVVDEEIGEYIHITDYVLIGRFSFQVGEGELTDQSIAVKGANTSPTTGLKININGQDGQGDYYEEPTIFEFVLNLKSDNAYLSNIILSTGEVDEENPDNSTYKEYDLDPEFNKETFTYNVEILEYIDKMDLKITKDDENSTIIMKVPKRDEDGNLMYEQDGTTIIYEEQEITDPDNLTQEVLTEFVLNKLGEPDTIIELKVTSEDEGTTKTYQIIISRPYGTIKGKIQLGDGLRESMDISYGIITKYIADITIYEANQFNWDGVVPAETTLDELDDLDEIMRMKSDDEGNYEIFIIPGIYDCIIERKRIFSTSSKEYNNKSRRCN